MALPNLVTGSLRSKIDRILAFKQVVSTVALHGTKHDTTLHSSVRLFRCSTCRGTSIQATKEYEKTRPFAGATTWFSSIHCKQLCCSRQGNLVYHCWKQNRNKAPEHELRCTEAGMVAILPTPGLVMRLAKPLETVTTSEHMAVSAKFLETLETKVAS